MVTAMNLKNITDNSEESNTDLTYFKICWPQQLTTAKQLNEVLGTWSQSKLGVYWYGSCGQPQGGSCLEIYSIGVAGHFEFEGLIEPVLSKNLVQFSNFLDSLATFGLVKSLCAQK